MNISLSYDNRRDPVQVFSWIQARQRGGIYRIAKPEHGEMVLVCVGKEAFFLHYEDGQLVSIRQSDSYTRCRYEFVPLEDQLVLENASCSQS